ncbi:hypothetical protein [Streptomyces sp. NPDC055140]
MGEDTLARRRRVLGQDHPHTLSTANNLAHLPQHSPATAATAPISPTPRPTYMTALALPHRDRDQKVAVALSRQSERTP